MIKLLYCRKLKSLIENICDIHNMTKVEWDNYTTPEVTIYTLIPEKFSKFDKVVNINKVRYEHYEKISLIATVFNERKNIKRWLTSIEHQSVAPDEVVIVDGGSCDGTPDLIREYADMSNMNINLIECKCSVAEGRNIAIKNAKYEIIAITDAGTELDKRWLEYLTLPYQLDQETQVVSGWYQPIIENEFQKWIAKYTIILNPCDVPVNDFLPSSRSVAVRKKYLDIIEGYPEWCTLSGEDTQMDIKLKHCCWKWAFVPDALVWWELRSNLKKLFFQYYNWGRGNGEIDFCTSYNKHLSKVYYGISLLMLCKFILISGCTEITWFIFFRSLSIMSWIVSISGSTLVCFGAIILYEYLKNSKLSFKSFLMKCIVACTKNLGNIYGFRKGIRNRPELYIKRFKHMNGDAAIVFSTFSVHDIRTPTDLLNTLRIMAKNKIRIIHIYTTYSKKDRLFWCDFNPDFLEEYDIRQFNYKDFVKSNINVLKQKCRLILFQRTPQVVDLAHRLDMLKPNSIIILLHSLEEGNWWLSNTLDIGKYSKHKSTYVLVREDDFIEYFKEIGFIADPL